MADSTSSPPVAPDASKYLANIVDSMHAHSVKVSYFLVGIIVLVLGLATVGGYLGVQAFNRAEARADAQAALYHQDSLAWQENLKQSEAAREASAEQVASLEAQIAKRDAKPLPVPIQAGLKPDATIQTVITALQTAYGPSMVPTSTPDGNVALSVPNAQQTIQARVDADRLKADLDDEKAVVSLQTGSISSLNNNLNQCISLNTEAKKTITDYQKAAGRTRFQKFLNGAEKVGLLIAGGVIGHSL
jgi:hypothetical protein